jgi:hypothetical protein
MRLSELYPVELFDLLEVAVREPARVLKWIIDNLERPLPREAIVELFKERTSRNAESSVLDRQTLDGVDLANAAAVLPRLDWHDEVITDVVIAHVRAGRDDSAVELLSVSPTRPGKGAWIAAHALLNGCDRTLAWWCGAGHEWFVKAAAHEATILLECAGQHEAALLLAQLSGERGDVLEVREGDEAGQRLAEKLCAAAGMPGPRETIQRRTRLYVDKW